MYSVHICGLLHGIKMIILCYICLQHAKCTFTSPSAVIVKDEGEKAALQQMIQQLRHQLEDLERQSMEKADVAHQLHLVEEQLKRKVSQASNPQVTKKVMLLIKITRN